MRRNAFPPGRFPGLLQVCILFLAFPLALTVAADELSRHPFVIGFERFARHAEIDEHQAGRLLIAELSCTACHESADVSLQPRRGPELQAVGSRLQAHWVSRFLSNPHQARPGTTMPDVLSGVPVDERPHIVKSLTAFLMSLKQAFPEVKASGLTPVPMEFWNRGRAEDGRALFHQIGCVACHEPDPEYPIVAIPPSPLDHLLNQLTPDELTELGLAAEARRIPSVPFPDLAAKYSRQSLTWFLLNPLHVRPQGRMPGFGLAPVQAAGIAEWLMQRGEASKQAASVGGDGNGSRASERSMEDPLLVAQGRRLFVELRCIECHLLPDPVLGEAKTEGSGRKRPQPLKSLSFGADEGCLGQPRAGIPHYSLDALQQQAVRAVLLQHQSPEPTEADETEDSGRQALLTLNCYACHERQRLGGVGRFRRPYFETVGHVDIGDEGRLPPSLTGVGARLTQSWMADVFRGKGRLREFMTIRMPIYTDELVRPLPQLLAAADETATTRTAEAEVFGGRASPSLADDGRVLMDRGCVQCHAFRGEVLPGTVGVDLAGVTSRVHPDWFRRFLHDPGALRARTRMPGFFPNGRSQNPDILGGDVELQIAAMWAYLKDLQKSPLPQKIEQARAQDFELIPEARPRILRTFMQDAGTHAIAVGFPEGLHFAFDARQLRLAEAWRGRFLDAQGTWFVRSAPVAEPLGDHRMHFAAGPPFALLSGETEPWPDGSQLTPSRFLGYRLDSSGVPAFRYQVFGWIVTDRMVPAAAEQSELTRTLTLERGPEADTHSGTLWFLGHRHASLTVQQDGSCLGADGLRVSLSGPAGLKTILRKSDGMDEWMAALPVPENSEGPLVIEVHYRW